MGGVGGEAVAGPAAERAARLVLGRSLGDGVDREELKAAFRRRSLELHPDRAAALGRDPHALAEEFRALCAASALLEGLCPRAPPAARAARRQAGLPPRAVRFAEYLYYAGRINWCDLAEAIAWQRRAGRRIGAWFLERGLIAPGDVQAVRQAVSAHNAGQRR